MTNQVKETRSEQIEAVVTHLTELGYEGAANSAVVNAEQGLFTHRDVAEVSTEKLCLIAELLIPQMPKTDNPIGKVIDFIYEDGGFDIFNEVTNWKQVGEKILFTDSEEETEKLYGFIHPEYLQYVDEEAVGKSIENQAIVDFERQIVLRIW